MPPSGRATPEAAEEAPHLGTWLKGKFILERKLGTGGMAVVYAARHRNKKRFAIKLLHPELSRNADMRARFLREGYVANSVDHPGAVAVIDDDIAEDGSAFLVMELLDGATLEQLAVASSSGLDAGVVLAVVHQVLQVLVAAHAKNIVHRDIKPGNLFVTRDGAVKVLDFGIARLRDAESASSTRTGMSLGTPAFMSPEQALGKTTLVDAQSDLWSVGATMFTLLAGRDVHPGETPQHMMILAATAPAPSLGSVRPDLAPSVVDLVDRALAFAKTDRWPTAAAMAEAVSDTYRSLYDAPVTASRLGDVVERSVPPTPAAPTLHELGPAGTLLSTDAESLQDTVQASAYDQPPSIAEPHTRPGQTTEQPVSDTGGERLPMRRRTLAGVGAACVALGIAAVVSVQHLSSPSSAAPAIGPGVVASSPPSVAPAAVAPTVAVPIAPTPAPSASAAAATTFAPPTTSLAAPPAPHSTPRPRASAGAARPVHGKNGDASPGATAPNPAGDFDRQ